MNIESLLISDENTSLTTVAVANADQERKVQETVDFKMVTFSLSGKDYAIDIMYVKEIAKAGQFTYVPNTLPFVVGVYNLRGEIIPILDMRVFFNIREPGIADSKLQNLLILTVEEQTFGIIVDKIDKVVGIQKSTIQEPHPLFVDINIKYISGVVESNKRLYILLDIVRIFSKSKDEDEIKYEQRLNEVNSQYEAARAAQKAVAAQKNAAQPKPAVEAPAPAETPAKVAVADKEVAPAAVETAKAPVVEKVEAAPAPVVEEPKNQFDEKNYNFVVEGLKNNGNFFVSPVNESWARHRFEEWSKEKSGNSVQIQNEAEAGEFLKSFWSSCSDSWWSKELADTLFKLLPDNNAKQVIVWNPGCGKGMETYCLACVLAKRYPDSKIRVYAQDVDLLSVSNAPMITVPDSEASGWMAPFITKTASGSNTFNQQIKDSIMFEYHDCQHTNALPMVDLLFARDLLSLLSPDAQNSVMNDFVEKLKGNGSIILGENETVPNSKEFMEHSEGALTAYSKQ